MKDHNTTRLDRRQFHHLRWCCHLGRRRRVDEHVARWLAPPLRRRCRRRSVRKLPSWGPWCSRILMRSTFWIGTRSDTRGMAVGSNREYRSHRCSSISFLKAILPRGRIQRHGLRLYPTIEEALTLGGEKLAVDGVIIIGEHGDYPTNEKGQRRYPRYEWFKRVVKVFEASGRSVPVFNDKHLSTDWSECVEMVEDSRRLDFAFLAGSSLPVTRRMPSIDMPYDAPLKESVCVGYGGIDSYDFHALETAQCMSERRAGGEKGVSQIHALRGENLFNRLAER